MFYRLRRWMGIQEQAWLREVRSTPPIKSDPQGPVFVSLLGGVFTDMYLNATKSLGLWCPPKRVVVIDDGSMTKRDRRLVAHHLPNVSFRMASEIDVGACPRGGCWERLVTCIDESATDFVIQVDSDTVTPRFPEQVAECVAQRRSFTMSGYVTLVDPAFAVKRLTLAEAREARDGEATGHASPHIQIVAERTMAGLPELDGRYYVRGCAGFAGFATGDCSRAQLEHFSLAMSKAIGDRWTEWGTEQVASNFLVANALGSEVLAWPEYVGVMPGLDEGLARMIHFTGDDRFSWGVYRRAAARSIAAIAKS